MRGENVSAASTSVSCAVRSHSLSRPRAINFGRIDRACASEWPGRIPFVRARRAPLPPTVTFHVLEGGADEIATPRSDEERENYEAVMALAATRVLVAHARHRDMLECTTAVRAADLDWRSR